MQLEYKTRSQCKTNPPVLWDDFVNDQHVTIPALNNSHQQFSCKAVMVKGRVK